MRTAGECSADLGADQDADDRGDDRPGPSSGDRIGIEQMKDSTTRPITLLANVVRPPAIQSPTPVLVIRPIRNDTNAINGSVLEDHINGITAGLVEGRDDAPTNLPTLVTTLESALMIPPSFSRAVLFQRCWSCQATCAFGVRRDMMRKMISVVQPRMKITTRPTRM